MNFSNLALSTILAVLTICILQQRATGQWIPAQKYLAPFSERGCRDLQLNKSSPVLVADDKIYLFTDLADFSDSRIDSELGILVGEIDRKIAFSLDAYEIEWWTSSNFTYRIPFLSGGRHESRVVFTGEQRAKYNAPNVTASLITFDPASHGLETIEWPSGVPEELLPEWGAIVTVPEQQTTYLVAKQPARSETETFLTEVYIYNYSDNSMVRKKSPNMNWATASFVQLGKKGILVMLGGSDWKDFSPLSMDQVYVYVIDTDKWYLQHTSGPAPSSREWSCTVVAAAEDKSSHQIHLYGGHRPEDADSSPIVNNYYILSVPQFVWTRGPAIPKPRTMSFCNLLGNHRMLIAGGFLESFLECVELLQILDLSTGKLTDSFDDTNNYTVPSSVISSIGGGALGGTNFTTPIGGFASGLEQEIFPPVPPLTSTTLPTQPPKTPLGAIIGGTVGGVAFAILILCGFLFFRKRREVSADRVDTQAQVENPDTPAYHYAEIGAVIRSEMGGEQDWTQVPVTSVNELPNSIHQPVHELLGKT